MGIIVAIFSLPEVLLFLAGPVIDAINPKRILVVSIIAQIAVLGAFLTTNLFDSPLALYLCVFISSIASAITYPIEEVMIPKIVDKNKIVFANSLFTMSYKVIDSVFNGIFGFLIASFTLWTLLQVNAGILVLAFVPLLFFKYSKTQEIIPKHFLKEYGSTLREGLAYTITSKMIVGLSIPLIFMNFANSINAVAVPYYVKDFDDSVVLLGLIATTSGIAGMIGNAIVTPLSLKLKSSTLLISLLIVHSIAWIIGFASENRIILLTCIAIGYAAAGVYNVIFASLYQFLTPHSMLGRVNTIVDSLITVAMPLGGIVGGMLVNLLSAKVSLYLFGLVGLMTALYFWFNRDIRSLGMMSDLESETL
jgi:MFS family permease